MIDQDAQSRIKVYLEAAKRKKLISVKPAQRHKLLASIFAELEMGAAEQHTLTQHGQGQLVLAKRHFEHGRQLEGLQHCQLARLLMPFDVEALEILLEIYHQQAADKSARNIAKELLALRPEHPQATAVLSDLGDGEQAYWKTLLKVLLIGYACLLMINWVIDQMLLSKSINERSPTRIQIETKTRK